MGNDPTIFARPALPRVSIAMVVCLAMFILAGSAVGSVVAGAAALAGAILAWRFGPLIGGIVVGALTAAVVMFDPYLIHPMPGKLLAWTVAVMLLGMSSGMVARRDSHRAAEEDAHTPPERPIPGRSRSTPVRGGRPVTGEMPKVRTVPEMQKLKSNPELQRLQLPVDPPKDRATLELPAFADPASEEAATMELEREMVQRFLRDVRDALGADEVALWQHFEDTDEVKAYAAAVQAPEELKLETKPPVDTLVHAASLGSIGSNYDNEMNYFFAIPAGAEGRFHGALGVYAEDRQSFNRDRAKASLKGFADRLAEILHLLYDGRETRRYRGKVDEVAYAVEKIQKQQEMKPLQLEICKSAMEVSGASRSAYLSWNEETQEAKVECMYPSGSIPSTVAPGSLAGLTLFQPRPKDKVFRENFRYATLALFSAGEQPPRPGSAAALQVQKDGVVLGSIVVIGDRPAQITVVEVNLLQPLARFAYTAVAAVKELESAKGQATKDALTGLHNRHAFDERMRSVMAQGDRSGQSISLILADVDKFKSINDTYGHAAGDEVLRQLGRTLASMKREGDFVARYGGEEIAIILPGQDAKTAKVAAERLRVGVMNMRVEFEGTHIPVTASFGVASHPEPVFGEENLFKAADEALYAAKADGRNCVKIAAKRPKEA